MADTEVMSLDQATQKFLQDAEIAKKAIGTRAVDATALVQKYNEASNLIGKTLNAGVNVPRDANGIPQTDERVIQATVATLDAQKKKTAMFNRLGLDNADGAATVNVLTDKLVSSTMRAITAAEDVEKNLSVKFLDSPVQYIYNSYTLESDVKKAEATKMQADLAASGLAKINAASQSYNTTVDGAKELETTGTLEALRKNLADRHIFDFNKEVQANAGKNIDFIQQFNQWDSQQLAIEGSQVETLYKKQSAYLDQQRFNLQRDQTRQAMDIQLKTFKFAELTQNGEIAMAKSVVDGATSLGYKLSEADMAPGKIIATLKTGNGLYAKFLEAGIQYGSTGQTVYGATTAEAAHTIIALKAPGQIMQKPIVDLFRSEAAKVSSLPENILQTSGFKSLADKGAIETLTAKGVETATKAMYSNVRIGDVTNIYAPAATSVLMTQRGVSETPFARNVVIPSINAGENVEFNPDRLMEQGLEAVKSGKLKLEDVADGISKMGIAARLYNAGTKQYMGFGIAPPLKLNMEVDGVGILGGKQIKDVSSYKEVMGALTAKQRIRNPSTEGALLTWDGK